MAKELQISHVYMENVYISKEKDKKQDFFVLNVVLLPSSKHDSLLRQY